MQQSVSVLLVSLVAGLFMTGCPEKNVEKEEPAAAAPAPKSQHRAATDDKAAEDEHAEEAADDHVDEPKDEKKPVHKRHSDKKEQAGDEKDQGGW